MTLMKSISGIRGTIGGLPGDNLTPVDIVKFVHAYARFILRHSAGKGLIVVGRDGRSTGSMVNALVISVLQSSGLDVYDLGLSTTPTVEMAVTHFAASGGIIITASHNPAQWNALKLLDAQGEFLNQQQGEEVLQMAESAESDFVPYDRIGVCQRVDNFLDIHIAKVLAMPFVNPAAIAAKGFSVVVDAVNSTGSIAVPALLKALGVKQITVLNGFADGHFAHDPEPLPANLMQISKAVVEQKAQVGIVVDPDVDRLALVCEDGSMFGEEYTLVAVSDYVLRHHKGNTVSNLSSTRALADVTQAAGGEYFASAVGEVNVVASMKKQAAVIGGEGNGGVIVPALHYGRDALAGIALFLSHLAAEGISASALRDRYPRYCMSKNKLELPQKADLDAILNKMSLKYAHEKVNLIDGVKIDFPDSWVHMRKSNTEPIIRVYSEARTAIEADALALKFVDELKALAV